MTSGKRSWFNEHTRDYYAGALMMLIGLEAVAQGSSYNIGSLTAMGSGFFPVALGIILTLLGILIAGSAKRARRTALLEEKLQSEWRGWICILSGVAAFVVLGNYGGLLPATVAIVFISALGDRDNSIKSALILAAAMAVVCVLVFWWALQLQFPLFTWGYG